MKIAHPTATGLVIAGHYRVFSISATPAAADATITVVNSATTAVGVEVVNTLLAKANGSTVQITFPGGVDCDHGIWVSVLTGAGASFSIQHDGG